MNRRDFLKTSLAAAAAAAGSVFLGGALLNVAAAPAERKGQGGKMKILVITGSPRKNGNSSTLAEHFIRGAEEAGHEIVRFDAAFKEVHPCIACNKCGMNGECVFKDDFEFVRKHILDAGMVVFATPMYYFGISAQIKAVIDRFYAINGSIHVPKKAALLMTYADNNKRKEKAITDHYEVLLDYLGWSDAGQVIAPGVWPVGAVNHTKYPEQAYLLGKSV
ncbi:flavodoxin family protein [uncultured Victivallis sp.]|uniref:flavodoxin family protein n=1 Tax=uncultured Victivallis sp. TaxID=354118 RepID=UPI0025F5C95C|nr:flavodoxin family protein [uncultured Victivallis sp.]